MKKIFSVILLAAVVMSIAVIGTSAAQIYLQDDFSGDSINAENWIAEGTKFFVEDGMLQGYKDAVMHQSAYGNPDNGQPYGKDCDWKTFVAEMKFRIVETDNPGSDQALGIWVRAFGDDSFDREVSGQVYTLGYDHTNSAYIIGRDDWSAKGERNIISVPTEKWQEGTDASWHTLGVKVEASGMISLWADGKKVVELDTSNPANTGSEETYFKMGVCDTPVLVKNTNNFIQIDDFIVASPDYYSEAVDPAPGDDTTNNGADTGSNGADTDNNGSNNGSNDGNTGNAGNNTGNNGGNTGNNDGNTGNNGGNNKPNATDTNKNQSGSASTGDALYIAVAVAVAALGSAIVVKKVASK